MAKSKNHKEDETLLGELRQLRAENKALKRRLKQVEKRQHTFDKADDIEDFSDRKSSLPIAATCTDCGKGFITEVDLGARILYKCGVCQWRITRPKVKT